MADTTKTDSLDYTTLLTDLARTAPRRVTLDKLNKRVQKKLDALEPETWKAYLRSVLLQNLAAIFFESEEEPEDKEISAMTTSQDNVIEREMLLAAAAAIDSGDTDTAVLILEAMDEDDGVDALEQELEVSPYARLNLIQNQSIEIGRCVSWLRMTMDRAPTDPQWLKYCRLHRALRVGPITWDFPILPHEESLDVLRTIKDETGYSPRWYTICDQRGGPSRDVPGEPFIS